MTKKYDFKGTTFLMDKAPEDNLSSMNGYVVTYAKTPGLSATVWLAETPGQVYRSTFDLTDFDTRALSANVRHGLNTATLTRYSYSTRDEVMTSVAELFVAVATDLETAQQNRESNDAWFDGLPDA